MNSLKLLFAAIFLLLSCFVLDGSAQTLPAKQERLQLMLTFNQLSGNRWDIRWNEATGTPASILGHRIASYTGTSLEVAMAFLRAERNWLGIRNVDTDLLLEKTNVSARGGARLVFTQKYRGIPVLASGYLVAVDNDGGIYYMSGDYYPDVEVGTEPALTASQARNVIAADLAGSNVERISTPVLAVMAEVSGTDEKYSLVYVAEAEIASLVEAWRYTIDANTGSILTKASLIERINGNGDVYQTNPLHGNPVNQTIHRLYDLSPRRLEGDNIVVSNYAADEAESQTGSFVYDPSNTHFDEVMVYYHSDEFEA